MYVWKVIFTFEFVILTNQLVILYKKYILLSNLWKHEENEFWKVDVTR